MGMDLVSVSLLYFRLWLTTEWQPGWYDSVYDEELGNQPCIFTSVTPVGHPLATIEFVHLMFSCRLGTMSIWSGSLRK